MNRKEINLATQDEEALKVLPIVSLRCPTYAFQGESARGMRLRGEKALNADRNIRALAKTFIAETVIT